MKKGDRLDVDQTFEFSVDFHFTILIFKVHLKDETCVCLCVFIHFYAIIVIICLSFWVWEKCPNAKCIIIEWRIRVIFSCLTVRRLREKEREREREREKDKRFGCQLHIQK